MNISQTSNFIYFLYAVITLTALVSLWAFFRRKKLALVNRLFFLIISLTILLAMILIHPEEYYPDGPEYLTMTESLFNHMSPDLQEKDVRTLASLRRKYNYLHDGYFPGAYFRTNDNKSYGMHFWGYSLFCLPAKYALHRLHLNELKALQITNALLLIVALFHIMFVSKLDERQKLLFALLSVFCPAFWFVHWTHPEMFTYAVLIISLVYMSIKNWPAATFTAAIASMQYQPLILWAAFLWVKGILESKIKWKALLLLSISLLPAMIPIVFYYAKFGVYSLLGVYWADFSNISLFKVWELFFDFNLGMLPYLPITLFLFFWVIIRSLFTERKFSLEIQIFLLTIAMMLLFTTVVSWNHTTSGPSRYLILMLPLIFYTLIIQPEVVNYERIKAPIYAYSLLLAVLVQIIIVSYGGGFVSNMPNRYLHGPLARFILNRYPALYSPSKEIFVERTVHLYGAEVKKPVIYNYKGKCKKVLAKGKHKELILQSCGYIPEKYNKFFENEDNSEKLIYLNY